MSVAGIVASGFFLTLAIVRPALPSHEYGGVVLRAALDDAPHVVVDREAVDSSREVAAAPARVKRPALKRVREGGATPVVAAPASESSRAERAHNPIARFLTGDGRFRVEPFPTLAPPANDASFAGRR
jgi:hypothetical protein